MQQKSILHIGKFYPPHPGGIETYLRSLTGYQSESYAVGVLVGNREPRTVVEDLDGARITRLATFGSIASMPLVPGFFTHLRGRSDDLVHLHVPNPAAALAYLLSGHRSRLVITHHGDTLGRRWLRKLTNPIQRKVMQRADAIIISSQRYAESSTELLPFRSKWRIIPLGIDVPPPSQTTLAQAALIRARYGTNLLVATGRLVPYKGFEYLIRALRGTDATLLLIGRGPLRTSLEAIARQAGVMDRVHFLGFVDQVQPYLHAADIFVLPSITRAESFGIVQLEAMAAGLPVINTDLESAVPEVSQSGLTGLTVPPADEAALRDAINHLLADASLRQRMGAAAIERSRLFTAASTAEQTETLYKELLGT